MSQKCILFDLDGTLTDSGEGIINCALLTLQHFGLHLPERKDMRVWIGPPLRTTLPKFGLPDNQVEAAITYYRKHYTATGIWENTPYPGIEALLQRLLDAGNRLFVATSKPEHMAIAILEKFGLAPYFEHICGSCADGVRDSKDAVIAYLLEKLDGSEDIIMVGDTKYDVLGAKALNIPTIGVTWGYGTAEELQNAGAVALADTMDELYNLLN